MRIALASQNRQTLTAHAGRCRHFFVIDTADGQELRSVPLAPAELLSVWQGEGAHPLAGVEVLVAGSIGQGVVEKLARRGIRALATAERDLWQVVRQLVDAKLPLRAVRTQGDARSQPGQCLAGFHHD